jgi:hypothetical protein
MDARIVIFKQGRVVVPAEIGQQLGLAPATTCTCTSLALGW